MKKLLALILYGGLVILHGCCTLPTQTFTYQSWPQRQQQLHKINTWSTRGALGIKINNTSDIGHFTLKYKHDNFDATIFAPLHLSSIRITGNSNRATFWQTANKKITTSSVEQLMQQQLGWSLPLIDFKYWALGSPAPKSSYKPKFDKYNHLIYLQQQDWKIYYTNYSLVKNIALPTKITLANDKLNINIKVVISAWNIRNN